MCSGVSFRWGQLSENLEVTAVDSAAAAAAAADSAMHAFADCEQLWQQRATTPASPPSKQNMSGGLQAHLVVGHSSLSLW